MQRSVQTLILVLVIGAVLVYSGGPADAAGDARSIWGIGSAT